MSIGKVSLICDECGKHFEASAKKINSAQARDWERWAESNVRTCPECYAKARREQRSAAIEDKVLDLTEGHPLPDLVGSPKQIIWAESLRKSRIIELSQLYDLKNSGPKFWGWMESANRAKLWIDRRDMKISEFVNAIGTDLKEDDQN